MPTYTTTIILDRPQWIPVYIPEASSVRAFKKIQGDSWAELNRVDLVDVQSTDSYSYDDKINVFLFHPMLKGSKMQIQYDHESVPNPGVIDILPNVLAAQATHNYNKILSGLHVVRSYVNGIYSGWNGTNLVLNGGMIRLDGRTYAVGETYWDLNSKGAQAGEDIVTSTLFYLHASSISDTQKNTNIINSPSYFTSKRYSLNQGGGISSSLTELNNIIALYLGDNSSKLGFIEILRMVIISKKAPEAPEISFKYEKKFRFHSAV